jgi:hypothetical protein
MILAPMRFGGYTWEYNPHTIKILSEKEIIENKIPYANNVIQNFGRMSRVVKGEGYIYGSSCFAQYDALWNIYKENKKGILSVPEFVVMEAEFYTLEIKGEPTDSLINYSFVFIEVMNSERNGKTNSPVSEHTIVEGQNLWTVGNIYNISVEKLLELNPNIKHPFDVEEGEQVQLC